MVSRPSWNRVPGVLVVLRMTLGPALVAETLCGAGRGLLVTTLTAAFLSDVFDGVIARRLQVVTGKLRTADSVVDRLYFACVALSVWLAHPDVIRAYHCALEATLVFGKCSPMASTGCVTSESPRFMRIWRKSCGSAAVSRQRQYSRITDGPRRFSCWP